MDRGWRRLAGAIDSNLVALVVATTIVALVTPPIGMVLASGISPLLALLALLMLMVSLTFDAGAVRMVFTCPSRQVLALVLVYGPMRWPG